MSDVAERLRQGIDPNDIVETEQAMDAGADLIDILNDTIKVMNDRLRAALVGGAQTPISDALFPPAERALSSAAPAESDEGLPTAEDVRGIIPLSAPAPAPSEVWRTQIRKANDEIIQDWWDDLKGAIPDVRDLARLSIEIAEGIPSPDNETR